MDNLLIDCTFLINELKRKRPPHGIPRVILAYLRQYQDNIQLLYRLRRKLFILPLDQSNLIIQLILQWDLKHYRQIIVLVIKGILKSKKLPLSSNWILLKIDLNGVKYPSYFNQLKSSNIKPVVMIHDLFPIINPEYSDPLYAKQFEENIRSCLKNAKGLICVSRNTNELLTEYVKVNNLQNTPPSIAAPLAPGLLNQSQENLPPLLKGPYFVVISTIVARKNHLLLLHVWRELVDSLGAATPKLVIIGSRSSECSNTNALLDRCSQLKAYIVEITPPDSELQNYLAHARALLFPTFAEGYGLPLIEALSFKVPVICSDLAIFREIAADIPDYLSPLDGMGWLNLIIEYSKEKSELRTAQLLRLSPFETPKWTEHFNSVNQFLETIA